MPLDDLINVIETLKKRMTMYRQSLQQNEIRTRTALIDPLLTALGWDVSDPGLVTPEYTVGQGRADYALIDGGPRPGSVAIVEAKSLGSSLNESERNQMLNYANPEGINYAILTNGNLWELYDIFKRAPLNERLLLSVEIINTPAHRLALQLLLLWRPNLASGEPVAVQGTSEQVEVVHHQALASPVSTGLPKAHQSPRDTCSEAPQGAGFGVRNRQTSAPKQCTPSGRMVQYCVDGKTWIQCSDATLLMISIVKWCGQQDKDGADNYYEKLSHVCFRNNCPILTKERVTEDAKTSYSAKEINGWHIFNNLPNKEKEKIINEILRICVRQNDTSPVLGQDLKVEMSSR